MRLPLIVSLVAAALPLLAQPLPEAFPQPYVGELEDGSFLLNSGWRTKPAGRQAQLDTFPMAIRRSPDGKFLLVLHSGIAPPSVWVLDAESLQVVDREPLTGGWLGMDFAPGGRLVYVSGGATGNVFEFAFSEEGQLEQKRTFSTAPRGQARSENDFAGDVRLSPDGRLLFVACLFRDEVAVINPQSGWVIERFETGRRPYRILFHPDGESFYVTSWAEGSVHHHAAVSGKQLSFQRVAAQPMDIAWQERPPDLEEDEAAPAWRARLFVAAANANRIQVFGVTGDKSWRHIETIQIAMWPMQPLGLTPSALALSEDQKRLYVVCSDANVVAVVDVSGARGRVIGYLPTGWYPTAAAALGEGRIAVLNGRGRRSFPNPDGPNPLTEAIEPARASSAAGYAPRRQRGSVSIIEPADPDRLFGYIKESLRLSPYNDNQLVILDIPPGSPVPPGHRAPAEMASPIKHVLYIVKENRAYDQVLGDLDPGAGDPKLTVFGETVTPNHHKLAREFVLLDNFYALGDVDADGQAWATAAIAPAFVQRLWPAVYAGRLRREIGIGRDFAALPPAGYIWSNAILAGLSVRNYGFMVDNRTPAPASGEQVARVWEPSLRDFTNREFRGFDLDYPDAERAKVFVRDLAGMEQTGEMPRLMVMRLGNDHTSGTAPGRVAPRSAMADNDWALGMIVEACSRSRFWPEMAIFVVEDDAQSGADHVDSHRSLACVISPYARRGAVDHTFYNTASVLRTIELILGLAPMTQFDAAALPMWPAFQEKPDPRPYAAERPRIPLDERNP